MKIGVFDSGLGGLIILRSIVRRLPGYDFVYLGDTKRVPYGNRASDTIEEYTRQAVDYLFRHGCILVILACNTASAEALRKIQRHWLPHHYPDHRVLGVIVPTAEEVSEHGHPPIGVLATTATIASKVYEREIHKRRPRWKVYGQAAPLLVPLIEHDGLRFAEPIIRQYLQPLRRRRVASVILGCTHYPLAKRIIQRQLGTRVKVYSQDHLIPQKLATYLRRHPEIDRRLTRRGRREFVVTELTPTLRRQATRWFGKGLKLKKVYIE